MKFSTDCNSKYKLKFDIKLKSIFRYIGMELCAGTLNDIVEGVYSHGRLLGDNKEILRQITSGLAHLHAHRVLHRDLKPTNILISCQSETMKPMMKLADFDQARHKGDSTLSKSFPRTVSSNGVVSRFGTLGWQAPEIINEEETYSFFSDIFPLGLIYA